MATGKQQVLRAVYPLLMKATKWLGKNTQVLQNTHHKHFKIPIYHFALALNNGTNLLLEAARGKKLLLVNTASNCGYTAQYSALQQLQEQHRDRLLVIGFPANDFKEQESGTDEAIAQFCQVNFGVTFPLAKRSSVVKGPQQHPVYQWLTQPDQNGWNSKAPSWNFAKYLINEDGLLTHYFDPSIDPLGTEISTALST